MGPIGGGKTTACCWEVFRLAGEQKPFNGVRKCRVAIVRSLYSELVSTTIRSWRDWFPDDICPLRMHESPISGMMRLKLGDGSIMELEVFFAALEREEDTRKVLGMELTGVWFNEARELPWGVVRDVMSRIGRYPSAREGGHTRKFAIADTNPSDDTHWWYRLAVEGKMSDDAGEITLSDFEFFHQPPALIFTETGYAPNPSAENAKNLTDGYGYWIDQIAGREPEWIKVYIMGEYGHLSTGKPVYGRSYSDHLHCSTVPFIPIPKWPIVASFDYGRTPCCLIMQQTPRGQVRVLEEIVTEDSDIRSLCRDLVKPRLVTKYKDNPLYITGDPAGNTPGEQDSRSCYDIIREELKGLYRDVQPYEDQTNAIVPRLDSVKRLLSRLNDGVPGFMISPDCSVLRKSFQGRYKYRKIKGAGGMDRYSETPDKSHPWSDVSDCCQYGCAFYLSGYKESLSLTSRVVSSPKILPADSVAGY